MIQIVEKYILYGASFNPPHIGHFSAISQMLEEYDKVIVFPYPIKNHNGLVEKLPPIKERMKMLEVFFAEFFPQMSDRLILNNLSAELKLRDKINEGVLHTYDYLQYVKTAIPEHVHLSVCLGFDAQNVLRKEKFHKEDEIKKEFGIFTLEEETVIKSEDLRKFFSNHKNVKSSKDEQYIRSIVGNELAEHIFKNNLYGVKLKKELTPVDKITKTKMKI